MTAGAEEAYKALTKKISLSIENGLIITGIKRKQLNKNVVNKQEHTVCHSNLKQPRGSTKQGSHAVLWNAKLQEHN